MARDGVVDLSEVEVDRLSPSVLDDLSRIGVIACFPKPRTPAADGEINRACKRFLKASETLPPRGMKHLKALIEAREQLENALVGASKSSEVELSDQGAMRCLVACQAVVDPLADPVWRTFVPTLGYWLQDQVVCLIEDAVDAFRRLLVTLSTEDRRRTLDALLAGGRWAADLLAAQVSPAAAPGNPAAAFPMPQVESAGGWLGLYVPTL